MVKRRGRLRGTTKRDARANKNKVTKDRAEQQRRTKQGVFNAKRATDSTKNRGSIDNPITVALLSSRELATLQPVSVRNWDRDHITALGARFSDLTNRTFLSLTPAAIASISPAQGQSLTRNKVQQMSTDQFAGLPLQNLNDFGFSFLHPENHIANLTATQAAVISPEQAAKMKRNQLIQLSPQRLAQLLPPTFAGLNTSAFTQLNAAQIQALTASQVAVITAEQAGVISHEMLQNLPAGQLALISAEAFQNISPTALAGLDQNKLDAIIDTQANAMTAEQLRSIAHSIKPDATDVDVTNFTLLAQAHNVGDLFRLLRSIGNRSAIADTTALITQAMAHNPATTIAEIETLLQAAPADGNPATSLTTLVNRISARSTIADTTTLITQAIAHNPATTIAEIETLVQTAPAGGNPAVDLTALVNGVGNLGTIAQTTALVNTIGAHGTPAETTALVAAAVANATLPNNGAITIERLNNLVGITPVAATRAADLTALIQAAGAQGDIADIRGLINRVGASGSIADITALLVSIGARSTVGETNNQLIRRAIATQAGAFTIADISALVQASPAGGNPSTSLQVLLEYVGNRSTLAQTTSLVTRALFHNNGTTLADIDALITAAPAGGNPSTSLTTLVDRIAAHGTIADTTTLVGQAVAHNPAATIAQIDALVNAAPAAANRAVDLTTLVNSVANRSTITQTTTLVRRAFHHNAATTIPDIDALVNAAPGVVNPSTSLRILVDRVGNKSPIADTAALVDRAIHHNNGTTIAEIDTLVQRAGNHPNVSADLTALVDAIQTNATIPQTTALVQRAVNRIGSGHTNDILPLINRNRVQNTPARVIALLNSLGGDHPPNQDARLVRFNQIEQRIIWFTRRAANAGVAVLAIPAHGRRRYNAVGNVLGPGGNAPIYTSQPSWNHFYEHHSYQHFDFLQASPVNSMWSHPTPDLRTVLDNHLPTAINNGLVAGGIRVIVQNGAGQDLVRVGVNATRRATHLQPLDAAKDYSFYRAEINAINDLA